MYMCIMVYCVYRGEIHSGTVVTYNDKEEILCQDCSPDVSAGDTTPDHTSPPPAPPTEKNNNVKMIVKTPPPSQKEQLSKSTGEIL